MAPVKTFLAGLVLYASNMQALGLNCTNGNGRNINTSNITCSAGGTASCNNTATPSCPLGFEACKVDPIGEECKPLNGNSAACLLKCPSSSQFFNIVVNADGTVTFVDTPANAAQPSYAFGDNVILKAVKGGDGSCVADGNGAVSFVFQDGSLKGLSHAQICSKKCVKPCDGPEPACGTGKCDQSTNFTCGYTPKAANTPCGNSTRASCRNSPVCDGNNSTCPVGSVNTSYVEGCPGVGSADSSDCAEKYCTTDGGCSVRAKTAIDNSTPCSNNTQSNSNLGVEAADNAVCRVNRCGGTSGTNLTQCGTRAVTDTNVTCGAAATPPCGVQGVCNTTTGTCPGPSRAGAEITCGTPANCQDPATCAEDGYAPETPYGCGPNPVNTTNVGNCSEPISEFCANKICLDTGLCGFESDNEGLECEAGCLGVPYKYCVAQNCSVVVPNPDNNTCPEPEESPSRRTSLRHLF